MSPEAILSQLELLVEPGDAIQACPVREFVFEVVERRDAERAGELHRLCDELGPVGGQPGQVLPPSGGRNDQWLTAI